MAKKKKFGTLWCHCQMVFINKASKNGRASAIECRCVDQHTKEKFNVDDIRLIQTRKQKRRR